MFKLVAVLSVALLCALVHGQGDVGENKTLAKMTVFRLPANTRPSSYDLQFAPNLTDWTLKARAKIVVLTNTTTNTVTLNIKDLNVTDVSVTDITDHNSRDVPIDGINYLTENEQLEIHLTRDIPEGKELRLTINYTGNIRNDTTGLYRSSYIEDGVTKWFIGSRFEQTYARRAFPCYDEPMHKTKFSVSVVKPKNNIALSNMPILKTDGSDNPMVYFNETPPMHIYMVAIYVGEFIKFHVDSKIIIYSHQGMKNETKYVAAEAPKYLNVMKNYTDTNYKLPKMNLLAIPDFKGQAMESFGINVYREGYLLLSDDSKTRMKIQLSQLMQYKFTYQWFDNQVTCKQWDYLWLNKGFARYFQYFDTSTVNGSWPMEEMFVIEAFQGSLAYDQIPRHPIATSVNTPDDIEDAFDTISYSKAASVIRMLKYLVTENLFQSSLQKYLKDVSQAAAEPSDLFSAFNSVLYDHDIYEIENGLKIFEFMSNWTLQSGYPVLNISRDADKNTFSVTQGQFYINKADGIINETAAWHIGITFVTDLNKNFSRVNPTSWLDKNSALTVITAAAPKDIKWYIVNPQAIGFYRVNYEIKNWMALIEQLNDRPNDIHVLNRAQLIDDAFNLALAGQLDYSVPLHLSKYLKNENDTTPWYSAMNGFAYLLERMPRSAEGYAKFKSHVSNLAETIYRKLEDCVSKGNSEFHVLSAWETFSMWACRLESKYCMMKAQEYFTRYENGTKIPADIKDAALCVGVKNSNDSSVFDKMFQLYKKSKSTSEKMSFELALGCSTNGTKLTEYINHILDGSIEKGHIRSVISSISATPLGLDVLYEFLSTNLNRTEMTDEEGIATYIYSTLATKMTSDNEIKKLKNLKDNCTVSVKSSFEKSYEKVNKTLAWFNKYADRINRWALDEHTKTTATTVTSTTTPVTVNQTSIATSIGTTEFSTSTPMPDTKNITTTTSNISSATLPVYTSWIMLLLSVLTVYYIL